MSPFSSVPWKDHRGTREFLHEKQEMAETNEWRLDVLRQHDETKKALRVEALDRYVQNEALLSELFLAPLPDVQDYWDGTEELSKRLENIVEAQSKAEDEAESEESLASYRSDQNQKLVEFRSMMKEVRTTDDSLADLHQKIAQHSKKRSELSWVAESLEDDTLYQRGKLCKTSKKDEMIRNKILEDCTSSLAL